MKKVTLILAVALAFCIAVMPSLAATAFPAASGSYDNTGVIGDASTTLTQTVAEDGSSIALTGAEGFININVATGYIGNWAVGQFHRLCFHCGSYCERRRCIYRNPG